MESFGCPACLKQALRADLALGFEFLLCAEPIFFR